MIELALHIVTAILFIWSLVLLWIAWHLWRFVEEERRSIERWKRLRKVAESQRSRWQ